MGLGGAGAAPISSSSKSETIMGDLEKESFCYTGAHFVAVFTDASFPPSPTPSAVKEKFIFSSSSLSKSLRRLFCSGCV
jgi:hypothetical protein